MRRLLLVSLCLVLPSFAHGANYYVSTVGSDANTPTQAQALVNGLPTTPWATLAHACAVAVAGDTVFFRGGTYAPPGVRVFCSHSGTVSNPITFRNFVRPDGTQELPVIDFNAANSTGWATGSDGAPQGIYPAQTGGLGATSYLIFQGLEVKGAQFAFKVINGDHIIWRQMNLHDNGQGILGNCWHCTVERSWLHHNGWINGAPDAQAGNHNLYITGSEWRIWNNILTDGSGYNLQMDAVIKPAEYTSPSALYGGWDNGIIVNNTFAYANQGSGAVFWGGNPNGALGETSSRFTGTILKNNLFYQNGQTATARSVGSAHWLGGGATDPVPVQTNLQYDTAPRPLTFLDYNSGNATVDVDPSVTSNTKWTDNGTNLLNTAAPNFTGNPPAGRTDALLPSDWHLNPGSPAVGMGQDLTALGGNVNIDYDGNVRQAGTAWTVGAYAGPVAADTTAPTAPSNVTAVATSSAQINLNWTASTDNVGVTNYLIERCQGVGCGTFVQLTTTSTTSLLDTGLSPSTSYTYRVRATDLAGNLSSYSGTATAVTLSSDTTPPTAPSNVHLVTATKISLDLAWTASTDNLAVAGYQVQRCTGAGCTPNTLVTIGTPAGTSFLDTAVVCGTTYVYNVRAFDTSSNPSALSANVTTATLGCITPPAAPTGVILSGTSDYARNVISWSWTQGAGTAADGFHVQCGKTTLARTTSTTVAFGAPLQLFMKDFLPGQGTWFCTVTAYNAGGDSAEATEASTVVLGPGFGAWGFAF